MVREAMLHEHESYLLTTLRHYFRRSGEEFTDGELGKMIEAAVVLDKHCCLKCWNPVLECLCGYQK
jgi:hypothetical protein